MTSADLPEAVQPLRVVFVTDIHMGGWPFFSRSRLDGLVAEINRQRADLVLLGGDYAASPEGTMTSSWALSSTTTTRMKSPSTR